MKVLHHGAIEIAGNMNALCEWLRKRGVDATSSAYADSWLKYPVDINHHLEKESAGVSRHRKEKFFEEVLNEYDVFHFHFPVLGTIFSDFRDLPVLREAGKKIIVSFWGSDSRCDEVRYYNQAKFFGHRPPKPYFLSRMLYEVHSVINRWADVITGQWFLPRGLYLGTIIDPTEWSMSAKEAILAEDGERSIEMDGPFIVGHGPSNKAKKGTDFLMEMLEGFKEKGMPIEVDLVHGLEPEEARRHYANWDICVDQVIGPSFGKLGCEMMLWGIPLMVYHDDLADRVKDFPAVFRITQKTFESQLQYLVSHPMRDGSGFLKVARDWVLRECHAKVAAQKCHMIYEELMTGGRVEQVYNRSWFDQEYLMQAGYKSNFYLYMNKYDVWDQLKMDAPRFDRALYAEG